ncbi:MAG: hypothetical protein JWP35_1434 [Caulobacter sp.]|nr:hypothetical protein [Caulobacter sp.]
MAESQPGHEHDSAGHRLSAIVAIDLAGYSAHTETDEAAAVRAVGVLREQVERQAKAHGGRLFNSAGDGFMLEFPTASGALAAAETIARDAAPAVRVGVHLGEVSVTPHGDLLGHGVNVAARLQALARPGAVLVSDSVRRATQGPASKRLIPQGRVRLDKMSETVAVFVLDPAGSGRRGLRRRLSQAWPALAGLAVVLLLAMGGLAWWQYGRAQPLRVAVLAFQAQAGDADARRAADALPGQLIGVLTDRQTDTVAPEAAARPDRGGARLLVSGAVERVGGLLRVRISLDDRRSGRSLWSKSFERPAAEAEALEAQAAAKVGDVIDRTTRALGPVGGTIDADTLSAWLKLSDQIRDGRGRTAELVDLDRRIVARAPHFAVGHGHLAFDLAITAMNQPDTLAARTRAEARSEAELALKLDPKGGDAYLALAQLESPDAYAAREAILMRGLAADPQNPSINSFLGDHLRSVGRVQEAEAFYTRGYALDPLSPPKAISVILGHAGLGDEAEAAALIDRSLALFPDNRGVRRAAIYTAIVYGFPDAALARLAQAPKDDRFLGPQVVKAWRDYVNSARRGHVDPAVLARLADAADAGLADQGAVMNALAQAGDPDRAFAVALSAFGRRSQIYTSQLFDLSAASMRRDPRFMTLAARLGLTAYWRTTGRWPDFCSDPGLPYDCKTAAAKAAGRGR